MEQNIIVNKKLIVPIVIAAHQRNGSITYYHQAVTKRNRVPLKKGSN